MGFAPRRRTRYARVYKGPRNWQTSLADDGEWSVHEGWATWREAQDSADAWVRNAWRPRY